MATISYRSSRLEFRRDLIEPLAPEDRIRIETPSGIFELSKGDFQQAFPNVAASLAYREGGSYHYPKVPRRALAFLTEPSTPLPLSLARLVREVYPLPEVLRGIVQPSDYRRWIQTKAIAHVRRDSKRWGRALSVTAYKQAIHRAVLEHNGSDPYTGEALRWDLLRTYNNEKSKAGGTDYKRGFRLLPTIDHIDNAASDAPAFKVLSWEVNAAKNDMTPEAFVALCQRVASYQERESR